MAAVLPAVWSSIGSTSQVGMVYGQTIYTWSPVSTAGVFSDPANWVGGAVPVSSATSTIRFTADQGNYFARNDLGILSVNVVSISNVLTVSAPTVQSTSNSTTGASTFRLTGTNPSMDFTGSGIVFGQLLNQAATQNLAGTGILLAPTSGTTNIVGKVWGTINIGGATASTGTIGGTGGIRVALQSPAGTITSASSNSFTGGVSLDSGAISFQNAGAWGGSANTITVNGGFVRGAVAPTADNPFLLNTDLLVTDGALTLGGAVQGGSPGAGLVIGRGLGLFNRATLTLLNSVTATGRVLVAGEPIRVDDGDRALPGNILNLSGSGNVLGASSVTVGYNGQLGLLGLGTQRVADGAPVLLNSGRLFLSNTASGMSSETVGAVTVNGTGMFFVTGTVTGSQASLTAASLVRNGNSTIYISGDLPQRDGVSTTVAGNRGTLTFTGGLPGVGAYSAASDPTQTPMIPWAAGFSPLGSSGIFEYRGINRLVVYNTSPALGATGINFIDPANSPFFKQVALLNGLTGTTLSPATVADITDKNLHLSAAGTGTTSQVLSVDSPGLTVQSLVASAPRTSTRSVVLVGDGTINVSSGLVASLGVKTNLGVEGLYFSGPSLNFGSTRGYLQLGRDIFFNYRPTLDTNIPSPNGLSTLNGSNGIVVSGLVDTGLRGLNTLVLDGFLPNNFTGGLFINGGATVAFRDDNKLGAAGEGVTLDGGTLMLGLPYIDSDFDFATVNRPVTLGPSGGGLQVWGQNSFLFVQGQISGSGSLSVTAPGVGGIPGGTVLLLANNAYAGTTDVLPNASLAIGSDDNVGTGPIRLTSGGSATTSSILVLAGPSFAKPIQTAGTSRIFNSYAGGGFDAVYSGQITNLGVGIPSLSFEGYGSTTITASQEQFYGPLGVNTRLILAQAGVFPNVGQITVGSGGTLTLDNSSTNLPDRLGPSASVLLSTGGILELIGMAGASTTELITVLNSGGLATNTVIVSPGSSGTAVLTTNRITGTQALRKQGAGTLVVASDASSAFSGTLLISGGVVQVGTSTGVAAGSLGTGIVEVGPGTTLQFRRGGTLAVGNTLVGQGLVAFEGGTYTLPGNNPDLSGQITVASGTLQVGAGSSNGSVGTASVALSSPATLAFNRSDTVTFDNGLTGSGTVAQTGTGTTILNSSNYTGPTLISAGNLVVNGTHSPAGAYTVSGSGTLGGFGNIASTVTVQSGAGIAPGVASSSATTLTVGSLSYSGGGFAAFDLASNTAVGGSVNDLITVTGLLSVNGTNFIRPVRGSLGLAQGTYKLIGFGSNTGSGSFTLDPAFTSRVYAVSIDTVSKFVVLNVTGNDTPFQLVWTGVSNAATWDNVTTPNFNVQPTTTSSQFYANDVVTFNDTSTNRTVTLAGTLYPSSVTVNTAGTYTFTGSGSVNGTLNFTKSGTGLLVLNTSNNFGGSLTVSSGTLQVGNGGTNGFIGAASIANSGTLSFNRSGTVVLPGVVSGAGTISVNGGVTLGLTGANTFTGPLIINSGTVAVGLGGSTGSLGTGPVTNNASGALVFSRSGTLEVSSRISGLGAVSFGGGGTFVLTANNSYLGNTTISPNTTLQIGNGGTTGNLSATPITNNGIVSISRSDDFVFPAAMSGTGTFTKFAGGRVYLTGNSSISGTTTIDTTTVVIGSNGTTGSIGSGAISGANGGTLAIYRSDAVTLSNSLTGSLNVEHLGSSTTTFTGGSLMTASGTLTITNGAVSMGDGGTTGVWRPSAIFNNGLFIINRSDNPSPAGFSSVISGTGRFRKSGAGLLLLTGFSTYTGDTEVTEGTLSMGLGAGTGGISPLSNITVTGSGSTIVFNRGATYTIPNFITGTGNVSVGTAISTVTFTGNSNYSGRTNILSFASLIVGDGGTVGSIGTGTVSVAATGSLSFNRSNTYNLTPPVTGNGRLNQVGTGTTVLSGALAGFTGNTAVTAGTLQANTTFASTGSLSVTGSESAMVFAASRSTDAYTALGSFASISIGSSGQTGVSTVSVSQTAVTNRPAVLVTSSLNIATGSGGGLAGFLNLTNNDLIVRGGVSSLTTLRSYVAQWLVNPATGLGSSLANPLTAPYRTLAVFPNDSGDGVNPYFTSYDGVSGLKVNDVIVKYTYVGDFNLDGVLDGQDYRIINEGLVFGRTGWEWGDVNYDNTINSSDLNLFSVAYSNYLSNAPGSLGGGQEIDLPGAASIPEPAAGVGALLAAMPLSRRRRG